MRAALLSVVFMLAIGAALTPHVANAECRTLEWGSPEYERLIGQGWGPIVMFVNAPPPGTMMRICSDWRSSLPPQQQTPPATNAPFTCPGGGQSRPATPDEARSAAAGSIVAGVTQVCPGDARLGITNDAGQAKTYLKSLPRTGSATQDQNIDQIQNAFAICAANFLKAYQQRYGTVTIRSGYRSAAYDAQMCRNNPSCGALMNNPNPQGNHQRGLAIDVAANTSDQSTMWEFARQNPSYGVCFPFTGEGGGFRDTVHMVLAGIAGTETSGPGCRGVTRACDGTPPVNPTVPGPGPGSQGPTIAGPGAQTTPTSALANMLRSFIGPSAPPMMPMQPLPTAAQPYGYMPTQTPVVTSIPNVSVATRPIAATSAVDLINAIADPAPRTASTTAPHSIVVLNPNVQQIVSIHSQPVPVDRTPSPLAVNTTFAQQTFKSGDLRDSPYQLSADTSRAQSILRSIQQALVRALAVLRPFGGSRNFEY